MSRPADGPRAAVLTGEGRGAIAVVRVWGPGSIEAVAAVFEPARPGPFRQTPIGRPRLGSMRQAARGRAGDEVVAVILSGDPPEVEIQGHAGPAAIASVLDALAAAGVRLVAVERWWRDQARSRIASQALGDLSRATTVRTASILLDQAAGALDRALLDLARDGDRVPDAGGIDALIDRGRIGVRLISGWRVVLAGRPNVGKSRLLNALAGYDRAIVHERPGTTRDVVTVPLALDGWPVEVADTAGLREPADAVEAAGVARAGRAHDEADLVVLLLDRSEPLRDEDRALLDRYPKALRVASKADLAPSWDDADLIGAVAVSAETGRGLDDLIARVVSRLVGTPPGPGAAVPFRDGHVRRLDSLRASLEAGQLDAFRARIVAWTRPLGAGDGTGLSLPV